MMLNWVLSITLGGVLTGSVLEKNELELEKCLQDSVPPPLLHGDAALCTGSFAIAL